MLKLKVRLFLWRVLTLRRLVIAIDGGYPNFDKKKFKILKLMCLKFKSHHSINLLKSMKRQK